MNSPAVLPEGAISGRPQSNSAAQKPFFRRCVSGSAWWPSEARARARGSRSFGGWLWRCGREICQAFGPEYCALSLRALACEWHGS
eukprot:scaffold7620_cov277-Pinguiococcus_pyrenoidosus.AAC.2